ncbi:hypothetical protein, variant 1 [Aphanomyces astaci]|uniref:Uncharacterized protein n=1 Tax=Aphanomyces astaci TaxID=112090 RepID=W4H1K0_APHAT|nr:hypothetical protein, variant 1 [Aphanomyces astaci]ETV85895.1 hypothetical protein, variant 1 [Aphanomyces astaci]|eukprot:XP_009824371.1 hypothetical protein, variant 1 [Aphanomyces astaci]
MTADEATTSAASDETTTADVEMAAAMPEIVWYEHATGAIPVLEHSISAPFESHFTRGVKVSPDGLCVLSNSDDNILRLFDVEPGVQSATLSMHEGGTVYDFQWYPYMNSEDPATCVFITTSHAHPVHLWDAYTGALRASYRAYDHLDELTSAYSVAFNGTGDKIFCGFDRTIRFFDASQPSRDFTTRSLSKTKKTRHGQRGIISSIHFNPDHSKMYAAGSYSGSTCIYAEDSGELFMGLEGHDGQGVTQVQFTPNGQYLLTGARKNNTINVWDIRNTMQVLHAFERAAPTNQRIAFDIHIGSRYVVTGSSDARVLMYDLYTGECVSEIATLPECVNGVSFFPFPDTARIALSTGQRSYKLPHDMTDGDEEVATGRHCVQVYDYNPQQP